MNYTKTIREYCLKNTGKIFNAQQIANDYFPMVQYKSFLKILNRLRDESILIPVSKGVYQISDNTTSAEEAIIHEYASDSRGMIIGNRMYKELGVSDYDNDEITEIYTRQIPAGSHRNIGNYSLYGVDIFFTAKMVSVIQMLEVIEHNTDIINKDPVQQAIVINNGIEAYSPALFGIIVENIPYQYSTIASLSRTMKEVQMGDGMCLSIYLEHNKSN